MSSVLSTSKLKQKERARGDIIIVLVLLVSIIYYIPPRNEVYIGTLFGISLWVYFGVLNSILLLLIYTLVKGEIVVDFATEQLIFKEANRLTQWSFKDILGLYLLVQDQNYIVRFRPQKLTHFDLKVDFDMAYALIERFEKHGFDFNTVRQDKGVKRTSWFPILLLKYERESDKFNPEIPTWHTKVTLRTKLVSIALSPLLYIVGATLIIRIPYLLRNLSATKWIVSSIYWLTVFLLFDGGLYLLFGVSFIAVIVKRITKIVVTSFSGDKS